MNDSITDRKQKLFYIICSVFAALSVCMIGASAVLRGQVWYDEVYSLKLTTMPLGDLIRQIQNDSHPPLYYISINLLMRGVRLIYPEANPVVVTRFFSLFALVLLAVFIGTLFKRRFGKVAAGILLIILTGMPYIHTSSSDVRMYSWGLLFVTMLFWSTYKLLEKQSTRGWVQVGLFSLLCAYNHYYAGFTAMWILLILLVCGIKQKQPGFVKHWAICLCAIIIAYMPWMPSLLFQLRSIISDYWIRASSPLAIIISTAQHTFGNGISGLGLFSMALGIMTGAAWLYAVIRYVRERKPLYTADAFIVWMGPVVIALVLMWGIILSIIIRPLYDKRFITNSLGCMWISVAIALSEKPDNMFQRAISVAAIALIILQACFSMTSFTMRTAYSIDNYKVIKRHLSQISDDALLLSNNKHVGLNLIYDHPENTFYWYSDETQDIMSDAFEKFNKAESPDHILAYTQNFVSANLPVYCFIVENENGVIRDVLKGSGYAFDLIGEANADNTYAFGPSATKFSIYEVKAN